MSSAKIAAELIAKNPELALPENHDALEKAVSDIQDMEFFAYKATARAEAEEDRRAAKRVIEYLKREFELP